MAPARPKKTGFATWWDERFKTPLGTFSYRGLIVLCLCSLTPLGQAFMEKYLGLKTPNGDIEKIRVELTETSAGVRRVDDKVNALVVETERLKIEARRLALKNP